MIKDMLSRVIPSIRAKNEIINRIRQEHKYLLMLEESHKKIMKRVDDLDKKMEYMFFYNYKLKNECLSETKKRIFLSLPPAEGQLRDIQLAENYILQRIKTICDEIGIQFFLMGGTLLGAVRHHGFIPWDDDIDIGMMEDDCQRLLKKIKEDDFLTMNRYYNLGGSLYKVKFNFSESIFIDIFPFEFLSCKEGDLEKCWNETSIISKQYSNEIRRVCNEKFFQYDFSKRPYYIEQLDYEMNQIYDNLMRSCPYVGKGDYFAECVRNGRYFRESRGLLSVDEQFPLLVNEVVFEGRKYDVWKGYMKRLLLFFGDIWNFPISINRQHSDEFSSIDTCLAQLKEMNII